MKASLRTKLSATAALIVLLTVALISVLSNIFIQKQFEKYIERQQKQQIEEISGLLSQAFRGQNNSWNGDALHTIGMSALYDGYIIKVYSLNGEVVWDARNHDMSLCIDIMEDIAERMKETSLRDKGEFISNTYNLERQEEIIGSVDIEYYGPFFYSENDFAFLSALNKVLAGVGAFSFLLSLLVGFCLAKKFSRPILKVVETAKIISDGNYKVRLDEKTNTKELNLLIESVNQLAGSLGNQEKLRSQFTEDISHELRTPIAILQSHIQAMEMGIWPATPERLQSCYEEVSRIGDLISELETVIKADNNSLVLNKEEFDLHLVLNSVVLNLGAEIEKKAVCVSISGNCSPVIADKNKIIQLCINLLSNALKYSYEGGRIMVELGQTEKSAVISFQDEGIGISSEELPFVFERFYRTDKSRNRDTGGRGLGLSIVKSIVEAHGGDIQVSSQSGKGSCFTVKMPRQSDE